MIKNKSLLCFIIVALTACTDDPSKPTDTGITTIQESEQQESMCPYCSGSGMQTTYYGPVYCSYCNGEGKRYNIAFRDKKVQTLKRDDKDCPTKSTTFECIDEHNNGKISSTNKCIHCGHMYYVHD